MREDKAFVVVNPEAGGGMGKKEWPRVADQLKKRIGDFDAETSNGIGHGRLIAAEATKAGYKLLIAYGGDGTIHEVVNGIFDSGGIAAPFASGECGPQSPRTPFARTGKARCSLTDSGVGVTLGILSAGTGSDLIKTLGIPRDLQKQIDILACKSVRTIDVGRVTYTNLEGKSEKRVFVNITDAGIGAEVVRDVARSRRLFGRKLAYLASTLSSYLSWPAREVRIDADGESRTEPYLSIAIANGRYFGGGMPIAPKALIDDGFFDIVTIGPLQPLQACLAIPFLYSKQISRLPLVRTWRARKVELTSTSVVHLDIDGEPIGSLSALFELIPKALDIKSL